VTAVERSTGSETGSRLGRVFSSLPVLDLSRLWSKLY